MRSAYVHNMDNVKSLNSHLEEYIVSVTGLRPTIVNMPHPFDCTMSFKIRIRKYYHPINMSTDQIGYCLDTAKPDYIKVEEVGEKFATIVSAYIISCRAHFNKEHAEENLLKMFQPSIKDKSKFLQFVRSIYEL